MPLKAFQANGTGYNSDILARHLFRVGHGAKVINMSFNIHRLFERVGERHQLCSCERSSLRAAAGNSGSRQRFIPPL